jgi:aminoglycoside phosphotransferase (APT) family kinase protein
VTRTLSARRLSAIATAIRRRIPELAPVRPLRVLGSGFRSVAVETASGAVVLLGQSDDAPTEYARVWRVGAILSERLGDIIPLPRWYVAASPGLPHGALGYRKLTGDTLRWGDDPGAAFARDLGGFLARLHTLDADIARAAGVLDVDAYERMIGARPVVMPVLAARLDRPAFTRIEAWWEAFASDSRMRTKRRTLSHHDLWHDNLLRSDDGRLSGVLDLAHIEIADPAQDFAAPRYFGGEFMAQLVDGYRSAGGRFSANDEHRARRFFEAREFGGLAWAIEHDDADEVDAAVTKVRQGPVLRG